MRGRPATVRRLLLAGAGMGLIALVATCSPPTGPLPENAEPYQPPLIYRVWWKQVETCAGRTAPFESVSWFAVRTNEHGFRFRGRYVVAVWTSPGNRILVTEHFMDDPMVIRHEMLHAVLRSGSHPDEYFAERCGGWVDQSF